MPRIALILIFLFYTTAANLFAMDYGLRLKSHSYPANKRTSIFFGESPYKFEKEFKIGFFFNFYDNPLFGNILTFHTNDGQRVSAVASNMEDGTYRLALVVNDKLYRIKAPIVLDSSREDHVNLWLDKTANKAYLSLNGSEIEAPINLSKTNSVIPFFGVDKEGHQPEIAPVEIRNTRIFVDGKNTNHWDYKFHNSDSTSIDNIGGVMATVKNPHWLIDDHTDWIPVLSSKIKDNIQTAFNPEKELFYIIDDTKMVTFNPLTKDSVVSKINGGNRVMAFSNHLVYSQQLNKLINYNLNQKTSTSLDLNTMTWTGAEGNNAEEPNFSNHAVAISGNILYAFGGYGFYRYHNNLFTINLTTGTVEQHNLSPDMMPMTSSAAAVVNNKLYIFGGKGNDSGRQELPSSYSYALYEYDINTWKGRKVWEINSVEHDFLPSQTMYYDVDDECFYFASTRFGGQLLRISKNKPEISVASTKIHSKMDFYDFVFDLYRSEDGKRYYLVLDKRIDPQNHELNIYTISAPFLTNENEILNKMPGNARNIEKSNDKNGVLYWIIPLGVVAIGCLIGAVIWKRRRKGNKAIINSTPEDKQLEKNLDVLSPIVEDVAADVESGEMAKDEEEFSFINLTENDEPKYFNRNKSSISFLGGFCVRDREGNDITVKFTTRLKHLLIMLLLSSLKYDSGIKYQIIDEEIWGDKDEKSAQNNRNVSMRKLRILLEEVGDVVISYDKGFFRIDTKDVFFDYKVLKSRIDEIQSSENVKTELVDQVLELLLMGPMLPNTSYDWLDSYKSDFSNSALEILTKLLRYELGRDDRMAYKIAETISLHDTLNEDALLAKCQVLSRRKMLGLAKNIYSKFVKDYKKSMGEDYSLSFADVCKANING